MSLLSSSLPFNQTHPLKQHLYVDTKGSGDARPTALRIVRDNDLGNKWASRVVLVTGATSGIGIETARALHATGADVYFTARDTKEGQETKDYIVYNSVGKAIMGCPEGRQKDGFETQFGVNYLAHYVLSASVFPALMASSTPEFNSRVVAWMANYIDRVYGPKGIHALALNPGGMWIRLQKYAPPELMNTWKADQSIMKGMQDLEEDAATTVWAAAAPVWEGKWGKFLYCCGVAELDTGDLSTASSDYYGPDAYNEESENRLWALTEQLPDMKMEA
ncbi:hypothetical protein DL769_007956 [Monosporascus sp. CRB-8-3]|nr:hypothetical protein DL769_007956 [Monosporascus sp. CRB-8-3]